MTTMDGIKAVKVAFEETASPSLVRPTTGRGRHIRAARTFWIDSGQWPHPQDAPLCRRGPPTLA